MLKHAELLDFEHYVYGFTRKNGKKLGNRTVSSVLSLAKHLLSTKPKKTVRYLQKTYKQFLEQRSYPMARYTLFLYLKSIGYDENFIKEITNFKQKNLSALNDEEKMSESVLSKKELFYLVKNISKKRDRLIIKLLYDTGSRVSELTNIKLKDIDFRHREIRIMGKGRKPRSVFFQKVTEDLLKQHIEKNEIKNPNTKVIGIKPVTIWHHLKKYGKTLLNRDLRPHMLRHSRLQHMADDGVDSFLIKSYAGHSDISTTQIYVKTSKHQGRMAFRKAGDIWESKEKTHITLAEF